MGEQLKKEILVRNGILSAEEIKQKPLIINCPRCNLTNQQENKYCSKCSYPLKPEAYDELKEKEENEIKRMKQQIQMLRESQNEILECLKYPDKLIGVLRERIK